MLQKCWTRWSHCSVEAVETDDSFKKPGAVPFKWEIRPGVPKHQQQIQEPPSPPHSRRNEPPQKRSSSVRESQKKLAPPPAGFQFRPHTPEPRTRSFRSSPKSRSDIWRFGQPSRSPEIVSAVGCLPSPRLVRGKDEGKKMKKAQARKPEPDCALDLETLARWSVSTRKSLSPFRNSPSSSSFNSSSSSRHSSPRPVTDAEWAGFGLF